MEKVRPRLLFLYTELAGYFISCLETLAEKYKAEIFLVYWPVNKEAPFRFHFPETIKTAQRNEFASASALMKAAEDFDPDLIYCSGWIDKDYVAVCRKLRSAIPVVVGLDNWWRGTLKQRLAVAGSFIVRRAFSHAWVPGKQQFTYAEKLGFKKDKIRSGVYAADVPLFNSEFEKNHSQKKQQFPHRFIYSGRYYDFKGVREMWSAFIKWKETRGNDWELWCLGTGDVPPIEHPAIRHFGFVQPSELAAILKDTGVFILPSRFEPWGVVVHEFAAAGFPLLLSEEVGAASAFLREGENGFSFPAGDETAIINAFDRIAKMTEAHLNEMGEKSHAIAQTITPETWADTLHALIIRQ